MRRLSIQEEGSRTGSKDETSVGETAAAADTPSRDTIDTNVPSPLLESLAFVKDVRSHQSRRPCSPQHERNMNTKSKSERRGVSSLSAPFGYF